ncbi:hypothetical protein [Amycolatopsis sp. NPDC051061]|uniref:hypothetical protein n=1 Tax=Amycolatopsis sp. NPDC051061 TaxID=3155042 RepID=UPI003446709B
MSTHPRHRHPASRPAKSTDATSAPDRQPATSTPAGHRRLAKQPATSTYARHSAPRPAKSTDATPTPDRQPATSTPALYRHPAPRPAITLSAASTRIGGTR